MAPRKGTVPHNKGKGKAAQLAAAQAAQAEAAVAAAAAAAQPPASEAGAEVSFSALRQLEQKRKGYLSQLKDVERQIFDLETRYLESRNPTANALTGYEGLRNQVGSSKPSKSAPVLPEDRIFSSSSTTTAAR